MHNIFLFLDLDITSGMLSYDILFSWDTISIVNQPIIQDVISLPLVAKLILRLDTEEMGPKNSPELSSANIVDLKCNFSSHS